MNYFFKLILFSSFYYLNCKKYPFDSMQIKDLNLTKCDNDNYLISVENVAIHFGLKSKLIVSRTLISLIDLVQPIQALLSIERYVLSIWIPVPCIENWGSCTFNDLCKFGYPNNKTCPKIFIEDKVPCRCPIVKGNYTILPSILDLTSQSSLYTGYYKGIIKIKHDNQNLSCYKIQFQLYTENYHIYTNSIT